MATISGWLLGRGAWPCEQVPAWLAAEAPTAVILLSSLARWLGGGTVGPTGASDKGTFEYEITGWEQKCTVPKGHSRDEAAGAKVLGLLERSSPEQGCG